MFNFCLENVKWCKNIYKKVFVYLHFNNLRISCLGITTVAVQLSFQISQKNDHLCKKTLYSIESVADPDLQLRRGPDWLGMLNPAKRISALQKSMRYFWKNKVWARPPRAPPLDLPLWIMKKNKVTESFRRTIFLKHHAKCVEHRLHFLDFNLRT